MVKINYKMVFKYSQFYQKVIFLCQYFKILRNILLRWNNIGIPSHIVIILDGQSIGSNNHVPQINLLSLLQNFHYYNIKYLTLILVSQTSIFLPSNLLHESIQQIIDQIKSYKQKQINFTYSLSLLGDLNQISDQKQKQELEELLKTSYRKDAEINVRLGLFYSSFIEIYKEAQKIIQYQDLNLQSMLQNQEFPTPDIFTRTSGKCKIGDNLIFELSNSCCFINFKHNLSLHTTKLSLFKLICKWQCFKQDRNNIMNRKQDRYKYQAQTTSYAQDKELSDMELWRQENYGSFSVDSNNVNLYFMDE